MGKESEARWRQQSATSPEENLRTQGAEFSGHPPGKLVGLLSHMHSKRRKGGQRTKPLLEERSSVWLFTYASWRDCVPRLSLCRCGGRATSAGPLPASYTGDINTGVS